MKRRSALASSPRQYILLSLLAMALGPLVSAGGPSPVVQISTSTVVAPLDAVAMKTLCADQIGMCTVSCQSKIKENSCDAKTLSWICTCNVGTRSTFGNWQLPVPFQLCRRQLSSCLQQCKSSQQQTVEQERKASLMTPPLRKQDKNGGSGSRRNGIEQEQETVDMDIMDEFQLVRHSARLQATSFSKYRKHRQQLRQQQLQHSVKPKYQRRRKSKPVRKKRALGHSVKTRIKQHQTPTSKAKGPATRKDATNGKDEVIVQQPSAFSLDTPVPRDPICVTQCKHQFSCGTRSAPEYHNLNDYLASNNTPNSHLSTDKNGGTKAISRSKSNGSDSGRSVKLRLSTLASLIVVAVSAIMAHHVTL